MKTVEWRDASAGWKVPYVDEELSTPEVAKLVEQANKFETWLEQQIADQKSRLADATAWQESAKVVYKDNKAFFGNSADRGGLDSATAERSVQYNRLKTLEEVMLKFKEN